MANRGGLEGPARGDFSKERDDLIAGDKFFNDGRGLTGLGLVVLGDEFEALAEDTTGRVEFLDREERSLVRRLPKGGFFAGERGELTDADSIFFRRATGECEGGGEAGEKGAGAGNGHSKRRRVNLGDTRAEDGRFQPNC